MITDGLRTRKAVPYTGGCGIAGPCRAAPTEPKMRFSFSRRMPNGVRPIASLASRAGGAVASMSNGIAGGVLPSSTGAPSRSSPGATLTSSGAHTCWHA